MNPRTVALLLGGLACILLALLGSWFLENFQRVEEQVFVGLRGEARYNPLLAAERLLNELGIEADSSTGGLVPDQLPDRLDTLVLADPLQTYTESESRALLDWVAAGGHLVFVAPAHGSGIVSPLLAEVGIRTVTAREPASDPDEDSGSDDHSTLWTLSFESDSRLELDDPDAWGTLWDEQGFVLASREYRAGVLTVLASAGPLGNGAIGHHDNAEFVHTLVTDPGEPGRVVLVFHRGVASLWRLVWRHGWPVTVGAALLLLAFLAARGQRFGPLQEPAPPQRRSLTEHVDACGTFLYRHDGADALLASVRGMIVHGLSRRHRAGIGGDAQDPVALVARHTGQPERDIAPLFLDPPGQTRREFADQVRDLRKLWKTL